MAGEMEQPWLERPDPGLLPEMQEVASQVIHTSKLDISEPHMVSRFFVEPALRSVESARLRTVPVDMKGHIVVCGPFADLVHFVMPLRSRSLGSRWSQKTIVILFRRPPTDEEWLPLSAFRNVFFVVGYPVEHVDLKRAGCDRASRIVVLASDKSRKDDEATLMEGSIADYETILVQLHLMERFSRTKFVIVECINDLSLRFFHPPFRGPAQKKEMNYILPVVAAGRTFTVSMMTNLLVQSFYVPDVIEFFSQVAGSISAPFSSPFSQGNLYHMECPFLLTGRTFQTVLRHMLFKYGILVAAIVRSEQNSSSDLPFVFTLPPKNAVHHDSFPLFFVSTGTTSECS